MFKNFILTLFLFSLFSGFINSQTTSKDKIVDVKVKAPREISVNKTFDVEIILDIKDGWHINANKPIGDNLVPTKVSLKDTSTIKVVKGIYPQPILTKLQFSNSQMALYEDQAVVKVRLKVKKEFGKRSIKLRGEVQYQPCNDQTCLFPASEPFSFDLKIKK